MLKREAGIDTLITARQDRKFFFVYTNEYENIDAALREVNRLKRVVLRSISMEISGYMKINIAVHVSYSLIDINLGTFLL
jgi:hypothetical protein